METESSTPVNGNLCDIILGNSKWFEHPEGYGVRIHSRNGDIEPILMATGAIYCG